MTVWIQYKKRGDFMKKQTLGKKLFLLMLCIALTVSCTISLATTASAAAAGTMVTNPVVVTLGQTYYKAWTPSTDHLNHYVQFTVTQKGIVTITATKPFDSEGEYGSLEIALYNEDLDIVQEFTSYGLTEDIKPYYQHSIGLEPGTYTLTLLPGFYVQSGLIETDYSVSFKANPYVETEINDSAGAADSIVLNQFYTGFFGDEDEADYYKFNVTEGKTYRFVYKDVEKLVNTSAIVKVLFSNNDYFHVDYYLGDNATVEGYGYVDFEAESSGTAYVKFYNYSGAKIKTEFMIQSSDGLRSENGQMVLYENGKKVNYTGLYEFAGTFYYLVNGIQSTSYTGLVNHYGDFYYVEKGVLNWNYTGLVEYYGYFYHVQNGYLDWNYTGLSSYYGDFYYVRNGCLDFGYTGLVEYYGYFYHIQNGYLDWNYTGLSCYYGDFYYVTNGCLDWGYTGLTNYYGDWYYVVNGYLNWNVTTLTEYYGTWYYVENGTINWNSNTLICYNGTWYYTVGGTIAWYYTGLVNYYGYDYYVANGILVG